MDINATVLLSITCKGLLNKDALSKSDPFCLVMENQVEIGRTETIKNNLNPSFVKKIQLKYYFERVQKLLFNVRDDDGSNSEDLGSVEITLAQIISKSEIEVPLQINGKEKGKIIVSGREIKQVKPGFLSFKCNGTKLDKKDTFGKSDPYLILYNGLTNEKIYESEVIKNTLNPSWNMIKIPTSEKIRLECFDWDKQGSHDLIGTCEVVLDTLKEHFEVELMSKKLKKAGTLTFSTISFHHYYSFLDYIQNGTELNFAVAIDFTGSNGAVDQLNSLHYIGTQQQPSQQMTAYEHAISSIGTVVEYYDSDKSYPVFGFGAKLKSDDKVYHDFHLNFQQNPYVSGIQGILGAYRNCIYQVDLYGPTNFSPIIKKANLLAQTEKNGSQKYFILLICTDGEITDMDDTISAIIDASTSPLSIIIVGVGHADFNKMELLDSDGKALMINGKYASRDIVQFVPMRHFGPQDMNEKLPAALLAEIPKQVEDYMNKNALAPLNMK